MNSRSALCAKFNSAASHNRCDGTVFPEGTCSCGCHVKGQATLTLGPGACEALGIEYEPTDEELY